MNNEDLKFLKETLKLAKKGGCWVNPNPMVGAIIVKNGRVIGTGYHKKAGFLHAEIEALRNCREDAKDATLYVNLEPCSYFGKTPPCVNAIIKAGIKNVVCSSLDPNPKVYGKGKEILEKADIKVLVGTLKDEARKLNEAFFTFHEKKRPFVAIKFAASLDGKIATRTNDSKWITNEKARNYARSLRGQYQAVLVGINTTLADNPNLGTQIKNKKDPIRIVLDPKLDIPTNAEVLRDQNVIIVTTTKADIKKKRLFEEGGFTCLVFDSEFIKIPKLLSALYKKEIISVLVEGGGYTLGNFVDSKIIDKVYVFHAPILIGGMDAVGLKGQGAASLPESIYLKNITYKKIDDNLLTIGYPA